MLIGSSLATTHIMIVYCQENLPLRFTRGNLKFCQYDSEDLGDSHLSRSIWAISWDYGAFCPLQTRMCSHPVGLDVWFFVGPFVYFHTSCEQTAKALVRLRKCAGSSEPLLAAYVISIIISRVGSFMVAKTVHVKPQPLCLHLEMVHIIAYDLYNYKNSGHF